MYDKSQVKEVVHETKSLMPAYTSLSKDDLTNLMAYLDTLRGGVNNVADRDPPLVSPFAFQVNGNAFAQVYDALGRHVFVSLTAKF